MGAQDQQWELEGRPGFLTTDQVAAALERGLPRSTQIRRAHTGQWLAFDAIPVFKDLRAKKPTRTTAEPLGASSPAGFRRRWWVTRGSTVQGPLDSEQLRALLGSGWLDGSDLVGSGSSGPWVPIEDSRELGPAWASRVASALPAANAVMQDGPTEVVEHGSDARSHVDVGESSARKWHVAKGDEIDGPFTLEQLRAVVANGSLLPGHLVCAEGAQEWVPASTLAAILAPPTSTTPTAIAKDKPYVGATDPQARPLLPPTLPSAPALRSSGAPEAAQASTDDALHPNPRKEKARQNPLATVGAAVGSVVVLLFAWKLNRYIVERGEGRDGINPLRCDAEYYDHPHDRRLVDGCLERLRRASASPPPEPGIEPAQGAPPEQARHRLGGGYQGVAWGTSVDAAVLGFSTPEQMNVLAREPAFLHLRNRRREVKAWFYEGGLYRVEVTPAVPDEAGAIALQRLMNERYGPGQVVPDQIDPILQVPLLVVQREDGETRIKFRMWEPEIVRQRMGVFPADTILLVYESIERTRARAEAQAREEQQRQQELLRSREQELRGAL